jgi:hypothetical protein
MSDLDLIYGIKPKTITASEVKEKKEGVHTRKEVKVQDIKKVHKPASVLASNQDSMIETIRKTVKSLGKEVAFTRVTPEEKGRLTDIVYTYKRQSIKTSENEINRIAINFLIA